MTKLVERNTTIPTEKKTGLQHGRRQPDRRDRASVFQGEREMAADNRLLGPVQPGRHSAGAARRAADRGQVRHRRQRHPERLGQGPGHRQGADRARSSKSSGSAEDEIERMPQGRRLARRGGQEEAAAGRAAQPGRHDGFQLEKLMKEHDAKLSAGDKEAVTRSIEKVRTAAKGDDADALKSALRNSSRHRTL